MRECICMRMSRTPKMGLSSCQLPSHGSHASAAASATWCSTRAAPAWAHHATSCEPRCTPARPTPPWCGGRAPLHTYAHTYAEAGFISSTTCSCGWLPNLSREEVSSMQTEMTREVAGIICGRENVRVVPRRAPCIKTRC